MEALNKKFEEAANVIKASKYILLGGHANPDGDSIGSVLGFYSAIKDNFGNAKQVMLYAQDGIGASFNFLPGAKEFTTRVPWYPDVIVGFDYGDFYRLGLPDDAIQGARLITFDHHPQATQRGDIKIVDTKFSSTTELLYTFMKSVGWNISTNTAYCLLTGILTDTGGFAHNNTSAATMKAAGEMVQKGVPLHEIYARTFADKSQKILNVWGKLLQKMERNKTLNFVAIFVPFSEFKKYGIVLDDLSGIVSVLNVVADADFSLFAVEYEQGKVKGSFRSDEFKGVDVASIAKRLGGGGHKYAAGFTIEGSVEKAKQEIEGAIAAEFTKKVSAR